MQGVSTARYTSSLVADKDITQNSLQRRLLKMSATANKKYIHKLNSLGRLF